MRDDLATWQRQNVAAFLVSGIVGVTEPDVIGETYEDAEGFAYLPSLGQPLLIFKASAGHLRRA